MNKEDIIEFLKYLDDRGAIRWNEGEDDYIVEDYINQRFGNGRKIISNGKTVFYIGDDIKTRGQLKTRIIKHMEDNAWEKSGYEEIMKLEELLESLEMEIT